MHKALLVDEIARRIAEQLSDRSDKSSSLAFSLCCRSLSDPVLDVLWSWQTDLVTLFKVLPPDLWAASNTTGLVSIDRLGYQLISDTHLCVAKICSGFYAHQPPMSGGDFGCMLSV